MIASRTRAGVTLVELLVVLAVMGITAGVVGVALGPRARAPAQDPVAATVARLRREALRRGARVTAQVEIRGSVLGLTAMPDGSIIADSALPIDRFAGARNEARQ
jgi:prepilin-type N-terminal cleavage/methylation domain-containing protein